MKINFFNTKKKALLLLLIFIFSICLLLFFLFLNFNQFGKLPGQSKQKKWSLSSQYNAEKLAFENLDKTAVEQMKESANTLESIKKMFKKGERRKPKQKFPVVSFDKESFFKKNSSIKAIWLGHSSYLLRVDEKTILIDPVLTKSASPFDFMIQRFQESSISLNDLPPIDIIVISHDHYDHLDMDTIKYFRDQNITYITPLGVGSHLESWGVKSKNIKEHDWWNESTLDGVKFIAAPSQHFSGRDGLNVNKTLWSSWIIQTKNEKIYFSGDSGYNSHFKDIGDKYGPFDLAFIENGQYDKGWGKVHMFPEEVAQAALDLKVRKFIPIHWGTFQLAFHSWDEPILRLFKETTLKQVNLYVPMLGETVIISEDKKLIPWWDSID